MEYPVAPYHLVDDQIYNKEDFDPNFLFSGKSIYEVMHVEKGIPLFEEEHYNRFIESARLLNIEFPFKFKLLQQRTKYIIEENGIEKGNLKVLYKYQEGNCFLPILVIYFIAGSEITPKDYEEGVQVESVEMIRYNPNIKQTDKKLRVCANEKIKQDHVNEVILLDEQQHITEGSRSNIFFLKENTIITPPGSLVLKGITREFVKKIARENQLEYKEQNIMISDLDNFEHCFISSTSRAILPVNKFDSQDYSVKSKWVKLLQDEYFKRIQAYITERKK